MANKSNLATVDYALAKLEDAITAAEDLRETVGDYEPEFDLVLDNLYAAKRAVMFDEFEDSEDEYPELELDDEDKAWLNLPAPEDTGEDR